MLGVLTENVNFLTAITALHAVSM